MRHLLLSILCTLAGAAHAGQALHVEDENLARLPLTAEAAVKATLKGEEDLQACALVGRKTLLTRDTRTEAYVVTTAKLCEWGALAAPLWLVWRSSGEYSVSSISPGYSVDLLREAHHGMHDIVVHAGNAVWRSDVTWRFDGRQYRKARVHVKAIQ